MSRDQPRLFGTDGIRGAFGSHPLDEATIRDLGAALGLELKTKTATPRVVIGGDTRDSTPAICGWLAEELSNRDIEVSYLGVVPTPGVAFATRTQAAACGIVVSASHNPHPDNGIKLIDSTGFKWSTDAEILLERRMSSPRPSLDSALRVSHATATTAADMEVEQQAIDAYLDALASSLPAAEPLAGLSVALDTGHGAASAFAQPLFTRLGAQVHVIHDQPDGRNVNAGCGSTHPEVVAQHVRDTGSDLGFAFDGDADRAILADETGQVRDGDAMLFLWAKDLKQRGQLPSDRIVATSMSNLGLEVALRREGVRVVLCDVGDRVVVETMQQQSIELGGEQSGHIVNLPLGTTGDGLATALQICAVRQRDGRPLSQMLSDFERFPQLLRNIRVRRKPDLADLPTVVEASREIERTLGAEGRLVLRYSGTEPLVRIMIEGSERSIIESLADDLAQVLAAELS